MGAKAESAVPTLVDTLADPDPEMRNGAAMALENMGPAAAGAVPALIKALSDGDSRVRQTAVKALGNIGPAAREAVPVITRAVKRGAWPEAEEALRRIQGRPEETPSPETH
jgi:HEAT repeat protein